LRSLFIAVTLLVRLEQFAIGTRRRREAPAGKPGHDLAQNSRLIFRLGPTRRSFDAEPGEVLAQARQRPLMQKSGKIIRTIGQEFPAPEADEEIEIFPLDTFGVGAAIRERGMDKAQGTRITAASWRGVPANIDRARARAGPRAYSCARAASTVSTCSAGMCDQLETDGCAMPNFFACAPTPPATRIASSRPESRRLRGRRAKGCNP
jgi:hypothetical protein